MCITLLTTSALKRVAALPCDFRIIVNFVILQGQ